MTPHDQAADTLAQTFGEHVARTRPEDFGPVLGETRPPHARIRPQPTGRDMTEPLRDENEAQQLQDYMRDLARAEFNETGPRIPFELGEYSAITIVGVLQLALRHPGMRTGSAPDVARDLIDAIAIHFQGTPGARLIELGNDPTNDREDPT